MSGFNRYFSTDIICSESTVRETTVSFEEYIERIEAIVFVYFFFAAYTVFKIEKYHSDTPQF